MVRCFRKQFQMKKCPREVRPQVNARQIWLERFGPRSDDDLFNGQGFRSPPIPLFEGLETRAVQSKTA